MPWTEVTGPKTLRDRHSPRGGRAAAPRSQQYWVGPGQCGLCPCPSQSAHLQLAPRVRAPLVVQTVSTLVLRPRGLPLLQGRAPTPAAGLLPLRPARKQHRLGPAHVLTNPGEGTAWRRGPWRTHTGWQGRGQAGRGAHVAATPTLGTGAFSVGIRPDTKGVRRLCRAQAPRRGLCCPKVPAPWVLGRERRARRLWPCVVVQRVWPGAQGR